MKSIKPGRGPSMMAGIAGIFMVGFGIFWTVMAAQFHVFMALFGVLWTCGALTVTVYNFKNATGKNRHSAFDITEDGEEPDPLNRRFGNPEQFSQNAPDGNSKFCPYCGRPAAKDFEYCNHCGKKLP